MFNQDGSRCGFFISADAGGDKSLTLAGLVAENCLRGRKRVIWISDSEESLDRARRDLLHIGARVDGEGQEGGINIKSSSLRDLSYDPLESQPAVGADAVVLLTLDSLTSKEAARSVDGQGNRLEQLKAWMGSHDGLILFEESDQAKEATIGEAVRTLQDACLDARVVYASPKKDLTYMKRLGLWGQDVPFMVLGRQFGRQLAG